MKQIKFKFDVYNPNPYHKQGTKHHHGDCVIRAICKVTGKDWFEVYDMLCAKGREMGDFGDRKPVYSEVLMEQGFSMCTVVRQRGKKAMTVESFIDEHPTGTYLLRLAHHLTCIVDGVCYDTWYPQSQSVYVYFEKK